MKCVQIAVMVADLGAWRRYGETDQFDLALVPDLQVDLTGPVGTFIANGFVYRSSKLPGGDGVCTQFLNLTDTVEVRIVESETPDDLWKDKTEECHMPFGPTRDSARSVAGKGTKSNTFIRGPDVPEGSEGPHLQRYASILCKAMNDDRHQVEVVTLGPGIWRGSPMAIGLGILRSRVS